MQPLHKCAVSLIPHISDLPLDGSRQYARQARNCVVYHHHGCDYAPSPPSATCGVEGIPESMTKHQREMA